MAEQPQPPSPAEIAALRQEVFARGVSCRIGWKRRKTFGFNLSIHLRWPHGRIVRLWYDTPRWRLAAAETLVLVDLLNVVDGEPQA